MKDEILVTDFDLMTTNAKTQLIKALIPYLSPAEQKTIGLIIRFVELIMTIKYFDNSKYMQSYTNTFSPDPNTLNLLKKYCTKENQTMIDTVLKLMNMSEIMNVVNAFDIFNKESENTPPTEPSTTASNTSMPDLKNIFAAFDNTGLYSQFMDELNKKLD